MLNYKKCCFVIFANVFQYRKITSSQVLTIKFGSSVLTNQKVVTYLGLKFDWDLKWTVHIDSIISTGKVFLPLFL